MPAIAAVALTVVVLLALAGVVVAKRAGVFGGEGDGPAVALVAANVGAEKGFIPSVLVAPVEISDSLAAEAAAFTAQIPQSSGRGVRLVPGTQPGLYAGAERSTLCDVPAAANHLDAYPERSAPWAHAVGIDVPKIPYYLNTLTPVALIADTWVTASKLSDGATVPVQQVLQAGTAVLIDQAGVPRLHCATGDPLAPPADVNLTGLAPEGDRWPTFDTHEVVAVDYAVGDQPLLAEFALRDLETGAQLIRPAGGTIKLGPDPSGWVPDPVAMNTPPAR